MGHNATSKLQSNIYHYKIFIMCLKPLKWDKAENYREPQYLDYESQVDGLKCSKRSNKGSFVTGTRRGITSLEFSIAFKICDV